MGATLSLPDVLRDIPGDTVNALVGSLVITILLAVTTTTIIGVLECQQVYVSRWLSQVSRLRQRQHVPVPLLSSSLLQHGAQQCAVALVHGMRTFRSLSVLAPLPALLGEKHVFSYRPIAIRVF